MAVYGAGYKDYAESAEVNANHRIQMQNRAALTLTGILDVVAFDESEVILETELGTLTVKGMDLHVKRLSLDKGEVDVTGKIDSLVYTENKLHGNGESFFRRLWR